MAEAYFALLFQPLSPAKRLKVWPGKQTRAHTLTLIFFNVLCSVFPTLKTSFVPQRADKKEERLCTCVCVEVTVSC